MCGGGFAPPYVAPYRSWGFAPNWGEATDSNKPGRKGTPLPHIRRHRRNRSRARQSMSSLTLSSSNITRARIARDANPGSPAEQLGWGGLTLCVKFFKCLSKNNPCRPKHHRKEVEYVCLLKET